MYFAGLIEQRRERPRDDLVTKLLQPSADGRLSETELLWFLFLLLVAGNETTTGLLGNMLVAFATHPKQWALLQARPDSGHWPWRKCSVTMRRSRVSSGLRLSRVKLAARQFREARDACCFSGGQPRSSSLS